jgi:signal transduction histidine kinase
MWRLLSLESDGRVLDEDGQEVAFANAAAVARGAAHASERPVLETRLASGDRVALCFEPGRVLLVPLGPRDSIDAERLASIVAHDVRGPLRAVESFASFLVEDAGGSLPAPAAEDLAHLKAATARLRAYIDALVDYLRVPIAGRDETASLREVAERLVARFAPRFAARGGGIALEGEDVLVNVPPRNLEEVLERVVENVLDHHGGSPHAKIAIGRDVRGIIEVADDGPGIALEERKHARELFRRIGPRKSGDDRACAGLAIVDRAVDAWGGSLRLDAAPGGGLVVRIELPRAAEARVAA